MIWLILSILANTLLLLILKGFEKFGVNTLHGIVVNYIVAAATGLCVVGIPSLEVFEVQTEGVLWIPILLGFLFISIFFTLAKTAQVAGISVATVANKMSVVIPVVVALYLYDEELNWMKAAGICAALMAVWLSSKKSAGATFDPKYIFFPLIIFIGSGIIDALINHLQKTIPAQEMIPFLFSVAFGCAFVVGVAIISYRVMRFRERVTSKSILGGIVLGIPNYFSIFAVAKALDAGIMDSSTFYPVNNMGIVVCSAVAALIVFREKLSTINWFGILLSVGAIGLIAFA